MTREAKKESVSKISGFLLIRKILEFDFLEKEEKKILKKLLYVKFSKYLKKNMSREEALNFLVDNLVDIKEIVGNNLSFCKKAIFICLSNERLINEGRKKIKKIFNKN